MKQSLIVGGLWVLLSNVAVAQGTDIHSKLGPSGSHFPLSAGTQSFTYEATISGNQVAYIVFLDVYHNGVLKETKTQIMLFPPLSYEYSASLSMVKWGLKVGDVVAFKCRIVAVGTGIVLASHVLIGDVS